jgi:hypothetical protein
MAEQKVRSKIGAPEISLPKGGGSIRGMGETFSPNSFTGAPSFTIPISVTKSRGATPHITLSYSSGNQQSSFGLGFSLSLPDISRQTSKGTPKYENSDTFLLTGNDYLVPDDHYIDQIVGDYKVTRYLPRLEGNFDRIERWQSANGLSFWKVTSPDQTIQIFGKSKSAQIVDPKNNTYIFKWLLEETFDAKGNHILYEWEADNPNDIPKSIFEQNRAQTTNRYISKIYYGNDLPMADSIVLQTIQPAVDWHFIVCFDYGGYDLNNPSISPTGKPLVRTDPHSTYNAGFEIRNYRLCQHILLFHKFPEKEYGTAAPVLISSWTFNYHTPTLSGISMLSNAQMTGHRYMHGSYSNKSHPPVSLTYSDFKPDKTFSEICTESGSKLVGIENNPFQLLDLFGEGLPGILYDDGKSVLYQEPRGDKDSKASFSTARNLSAFPINRNVASATQTLTDVTGSGRLDLLVSQPGMAGFYEQKYDGNWLPFQPFESFPTDFHNPLMKQANIDGAGLSDLILIREDEVLVSKNLRQKGYAAAVSKQRERELPTSKLNSPVENLRFADLAGAGTPQLVRLTNGCVEYWPSLGYGRFGKKITMGSVPIFAGDFEISRLFLVDTDGSGTADLIYLYHDRVQLFLNQNGNCFAEPIDITLPSNWDRIDSVHFADINGTGTTSLIFSKTHQDSQHWSCDFSGGRKPYLLTGIDNNMGGREQLDYVSSTTFYLEDKKIGKPWTTRLPFPVQVLGTRTEFDAISQTETVTSYRYRDGYYDGVEREFRGFGRVDRTNRVAFSSPHIPDPDSGSAALNPPPLLTRTWYHTGAYLQEQNLLQAFQSEFWQPTNEAIRDKLLNLHTTDFETNVTDLRGAYRSLHGAIIRKEIYGLDETPWQTTPYSVSESQFCIREIQAKGNNRYGIFFSYSLQQLSYHFERNAADPQITHSMSLAVDAFGHVTDHLSISYGRWQDQVLPTTDPQTAGQQIKTRLIYSNSKLLNSVAEAAPFLLGVAVEDKSYEVKAGLTPNQNGYYLLADIKEVFSATTGFAPSVTLELLHWSRDYYFDAENQKELTLGKVTAQELHFRTEHIVLSRPLPDTIISELPETLVTTLDTILTARQSTKTVYGGYKVYASGDEAKYYWDSGRSQFYGKSGAFFLPTVFADQFGNQTSYNYDPSNSYYFYAKSITDANGNLHEISQYDFQTMKPCRLNNDNGNISEVLFDELGMVIVSSNYGSEGPTIKPNVGFDPIIGTAGKYIIHTDMDMQDVIAQPGKYLQTAADFFFYDLLSYSNSNKPSHFVHLTAEQYPSGAPGEANRQQNGPIQIHLAFSDGLGRVVQAKSRVMEAPIKANPESVTINGKAYTIDPEIVPRWLTSGSVRYNNKGKPFQQYEPYFINSPDYTPYLAGIPKSTTFYDALGRVAMVETPRNRNINNELVSCFDKTLVGELLSGLAPDNASLFPGYLNQKLYTGLSQKFIPTTWGHLAYDANNTLDESSYYLGVKNGTVNLINPHEEASLDKASKFYNSPSYTLLDSQGKGVETGKINASQKACSPIVGSRTYITRDVLGDELTSSDERLHANGKYNFEHFYTLNKKVVKTISVDAGVKWVLHDVTGKVIWSLDARGTEQTHGYDVLHRPIWTKAKNNDDTKPALNPPDSNDQEPLRGHLDQITELIFYGDSRDKDGNSIFTNADVWNLVGTPIIHLDQSGLNVSGFCSIIEKPYVSVKTLATDYKNEVNWTKVFETNTLGDISFDASLASKVTDYIAPLKAIVTKIVSQLNAGNGKFESLAYSTASNFDALERSIFSQDPDGNQQSVFYNSRGLLDKLKITLGSKAPEGTEPPTLSHVEYNEKGQRLSESCGGIIKKYTYDPYTYRLTNIKTTKGK